MKLLYSTTKIKETETDKEVTLFFEGLSSEREPFNQAINTERKYLGYTLFKIISIDRAIIYSNHRHYYGHAIKVKRLKATVTLTTLERYLKSGIVWTD